MWGEGDETCFTVLWALRYINILSSTLKDKKKNRKLEWWNHLTNSKAHKTPNLGFVSIQSEGRSSIFVYEFEFFPSYSLSGDFFDHGNVEVAERKVILVIIICMHGQSRFVQFICMCEATAVSASTVVACLRSGPRVKLCCNKNFQFNPIICWHSNIWMNLWAILTSDVIFDVKKSKYKISDITITFLGWNYVSVQIFTLIGSFVGILAPLKRNFGQL